MSKKLTIREKSTLLTIFASFVPNVAIMILGAIKTKYIITYLGSDSNGIYQTMLHLGSLVIFGNLGLASIFKIAYYKHLAHNDKEKVTEIYNYSKIFFKKITYIMIVISAFISILAIFFIKSDLPIYQIVILQFLVCAPNILHFYTGKEITLLSARQKEYIYLIMHNVIYIIRLIISLFIIQTTNNLFLFLCVDMVIASMCFLYIEKVLKNDNKDVLTETEKKDKTPITFSKYIIPSKVSDTIFLNIDTVIISSMISNVMVSVYAAYIYIANCLVTLEKYIINSLTNSLGNLYYSEDNYKQRVTDEIILLSTFIFLSMCVPLTVGMESFVSKIWINDASYVLDIITYVFICIYYLLYSVRLLSNLFEESTGSYKETCNINIIQMFANIVLSIILCIFFGMKGVIFATILILAPFEIVKIKKCLKTIGADINKKIFLVFSLLSTVEILLSIYILKLIIIDSIYIWLIYMLIIFSISIVINSVIYSIIFKDFRHLLVKLKKKIVK